jgi:hypothetical protein
MVSTIRTARVAQHAGDHPGERDEGNDAERRAIKAALMAVDRTPGGLLRRRGVPP